MNARSFLLSAVLLVPVVGKAQTPVPDKSLAIELAPKLDMAKGKKTKGYKVCRKDIARLCPGVKPGEERLGKCLFQAFDKLSAACKAYADHAGPEQRLSSLIDIDRGFEIRR